MSRRHRQQFNKIHLEFLEPRRTPSASPFAIVGTPPPSQAPGNAVEPVKMNEILETTPANGSVFDAANAPKTLTLRLNRPDVSSFSWWSDNGVSLYRVEAGGSRTLVTDRITSNQRFDDGTANDIVIMLPSDLHAGRYVLVAGQASAFANFLAQSQKTKLQETVITEFEITASTRVESDVIDLGRLGTTTKSISGRLTGSEAKSVSYRMSLGSEQPIWRLGLQLDAGRINSPLLGSITVYDASGNVVASADLNSIQPLQHPNDPYLFVGLPPGEYEIVVAKGTDSPDGEYRLMAVADPVDAAPKLLKVEAIRRGGGFGGFTLEFSSSLDPKSVAGGGVQITDAKGNIHTAYLTHVEPGLRRLSYRFDRPVPIGEYSIALAESEPLKDLIGRFPDLEGRTLNFATKLTTSLDVLSKFRPLENQYFGGGRLNLKPGAVVEYAFKTDGTNSLLLHTSVAAGTVLIEVVTSNGVVVTPLMAAVAETPLNLPAGSYVLRLIGGSPKTTAGTWELRESFRSAESLIGSAVGSDGALSLGLSGSNPASVIPPSLSVPLPTSERNGFLQNAGGFPVNPLGRPSAHGDLIRPVGPLVPNALASVALRTLGPPASSIGLQFVLNSQGDDGLARSPAGFEIVWRPSTEHDREDDAAIQRADKAMKFVRESLSWFLPPEAAPPVDSLAVVDQHLNVGADQPTSQQGDAPISAGDVERSSLELPLGVLLLTTSTIHLRRALARWWRKRRAPSLVRTTQVPLSAPPKPHFRTPRRLTPAESLHRIQDSRRG